MVSRLYPSLSSKFISIRPALFPIRGYSRPCALTGGNIRRDLLLVTSDKCLYILELTVYFDSNLRNNQLLMFSWWYDLAESIIVKQLSLIASLQGLELCRCSNICEFLSVLRCSRILVEMYRQPKV